MRVLSFLPEKIRLELDGRVQLRKIPVAFNLQVLHYWFVFDTASRKIHECAPRHETSLHSEKNESIVPFFF